MDTNERQIIDELFAKIRAVEERSGGRDAEAESYILDHVARQRAAPYYMAQTILVQQQALAAAERRVEDLERQLSERSSTSFLGGLFGGGPVSPPHRRTGSNAFDPRVSAYADPRHRQSGFLAGAAQTALGVAGGVLLGNAIADLLTPNDAAAAEDDAAADNHEQLLDDGDLSDSFDSDDYF